MSDEPTALTPEHINNLQAQIASVIDDMTCEVHSQKAQIELVIEGDEADLNIETCCGEFNIKVVERIEAASEGS